MEKNGDYLETVELREDRETRGDRETDTDTDTDADTDADTESEPQTRESLCGLTLAVTSPSQSCTPPLSVLTLGLFRRQGTTARQTAGRW
eukprot:430859-Rhodomonas_salina.1